MPKTYWNEEGFEEILSTHITGLQDAVGKVEDILGMTITQETGITLSLVASDPNYRIYQAPIGKRNWTNSPTPAIYKNGEIISTGFSIEYGGGAVVFDSSILGTDVITADFSHTDALGSMGFANINYPIYSTTTAVTEGYYRIATIPIGTQFKQCMFRIKAYTATGTTTESTIIVNLGYYAGSYSSQYSAITANTSHSYNSSTGSENGYVLIYCRVSFDANFAYIDVYKYKSTAVVIETQPLTANDWTWATGDLTVNPTVGAYRNTSVTMAYGLCGNNIAANTANSSVYSNYGMLGANTLSNTSDKTGTWEFFGYATITYNATYLKGHSLNVDVKMQELDYTGGNVSIEDFILHIKVGLGTHTDSATFNSAVPTFSVEIEGNTSLTSSDIAALVYSATTSAKVIRFYIKLRGANTVYCINPYERYGRSFSTSSYAMSTSYCVFTYYDGASVLASLPTPAQGSVVYATFSEHGSKHITGGTDVIPDAVASGNAGLMTGADKARLDGITDTLISNWSTAYTNNHTHSNKTVLDNTTASYTTAEHTKLEGIETGATADMTASEILTALTGVDGTGSGLDADKLDGNEASAFATSGHTHGNITNAGAIGSTANLPVITTTSGALTTGTFGTAANSFCQGNDSRLSNSRTPVAHNLIDTTGHPVSGLTTGHFIRATGATAYAFAAIQAADLPSAIDAAKIGAGGVTSTEFGYLDGVTSAIQTQLDAKLPKAGGTMTGNIVAKTITFTKQDDGNSGTADTIDWTAGLKHESTLTGNCTFTFTAPAGPCNLVLVLKQDATGSRTVTWPASVKWPGGTAPTLTTTASKTDIVSFYYDGTYYYGAYALNY